MDKHNLNLLPEAKVQERGEQQTLLANQARERHPDFWIPYLTLAPHNQMNITEKTDRRLRYQTVIRLKIE